MITRRSRLKIANSFSPNGADITVCKTMTPRQALEDRETLQHLSPFAFVFTTAYFHGRPIFLRPYLLEELVNGNIDELEPLYTDEG